MSKQVGKEVNDYFDKNFRPETELTVKNTICSKFSFDTILNKGSDEITATFKPLLIFDDHLRLRAELSSKKTYLFELTAAKYVENTKFTVEHSNGEKGGIFVSGNYENNNFGTITGKIAFPIEKENYFQLSAFISRADFNGFGGVASAAVTLNDKAFKEATLYGFYENKEHSSHGGVEISDKVLIKGGTAYYLNESTTKRFFARLEYNYTESDYSADMGIWKKLSEESSWQVKASTEGVVSSRFDTVVDQSQAAFVGEVDVWELKGKLGVQLSFSI